MIHSNLKEMSLGGSKQRDRAHELFNGIGIDTSVFFVCLVIIATYSVILKTITQLLQSVNMDVQRMRDEISDLLHRFQSHRLNAEAKFPETFSKASVIAERMATTIEMSRRSKQFTQRDKYDAEKPEEYYRVSLYIPYIDSLTRYKHVSATITTLWRHFYLHPRKISQAPKVQFEAHMNIAFDNFISDAGQWTQT